MIAGRSRLKRWAALAMAATLYPLSMLSPRSRRHWAFGHAGDQFAGNPKYLFLWIAIHRPDLRATWITGDDALRRTLIRAGYRAHRRWSPGGVLAVLRAGVFVFGHGLGNVNAYLSGRAYLLNLWHGVGLKAIHLGFAAGKTAQARREASGMLGRLANLEYLRPYDTLVTTSDMMQAHFATQTELPPERCPQLGYPRLDGVDDPALLGAVEALDRAAGFVWPDGFTEIYVYMPTYRDTGRPFMQVALPDLARLSRLLRARNALLYVKPHPYTQAELDGRFDNIRRWDDRIDINAYLPRFTGLITDYSSVLYDYLFARDTGIILYTFDLEAYLATDRNFVFPFDENVAGVRVETFDALCKVLADGTALLPDTGQAARIRTRFWSGSPPCASAAIVDHVLGQHKEVADA